uniref:Uncharacterized protein n=1 Tax=Clastoptera arizonana TaxID=38151 RepID=A0A1B6DEA1_9HEMI
MKLLLSLFVLCVVNNLVSTSKVNASIPNTVESTNLTAVSTSGEPSPEKNQTVKGRLLGNLKNGVINNTSLNRVKKNIPRYKRRTTPLYRKNRRIVIPYFGPPVDCFYKDPRPGCRPVYSRW